VADHSTQEIMIKMSKKKNSHWCWEQKKVPYPSAYVWDNDFHFLKYRDDLAFGYFLFIYLNETQCVLDKD